MLHFFLFVVALRNYRFKEILSISKDPVLYHPLYNEFSCLKLKLFQVPLASIVKQIIKSREIYTHEEVARKTLHTQYPFQNERVLS